MSDQEVQEILHAVRIQSREEDILRIMREQNCSRDTAEYVHKSRVEFEKLRDLKVAKLDRNKADAPHEER